MIVSFKSANEFSSLLLIKVHHWALDVFLAVHDILRISDIEVVMDGTAILVLLTTCYCYHMNQTMICTS